MNRTSKKLARTLAISVGSMLLVACLASPALATSKPTPPPAIATVNWVGNGTTWDGSTRALGTPQCDQNSTPYLYWVLSGSKAASAAITLPGGTYDMGKPNVDKKGNSTFKYTWTPGDDIALGALAGGTPTVNGVGVSASYNDAKNKATLTISHGCLGGDAGTGSTLTITFVGLADNDGLGGVTYSAWPSTDYFDHPLSGTFCEAGSTTNCVTFAAGSAIGTSKTLTLSGASMSLDLSGTFFCIPGLYTSAPTAANALTGTGAAEEVFSFPATTTTTWNNGDTLYWAETTYC